MNTPTNNVLSTLDILKVLLRHIWIILGAAVLCGAIAFVYCRMLVTPMYTARASLLASNGAVITQDPSETIKSTDLATSLNMTQTLAAILQTSSSYQSVSDKLAQDDIHYTARDIQQMVRVAAREEMIIIDISITSSNKEHAVRIANAFIETAPEYIAKTIPSAYVKGLEWAGSASQVSPRTTLATILAVLVGGVVVSAIVLLMALTDQTIKGEDDFASHYDVPILGSVPDFESFLKGGHSNGKKH